MPPQCFSAVLLGSERWMDACELESKGSLEIKTPEKTW